MPLTKQQLLIPRVLCIGGKDGEPNYPESRFMTGDIIEKNGRDYWSVKADAWLSQTTVEKFPHLFRPMPWWEGRTVEDLPLYLKFIDEGKTEFVLKVEKYLFHKDTTEYWAFEYLWDNEPDPKRMALSGWKPADLSDYQEYKKQKQ